MKRTVMSLAAVLVVLALPACGDRATFVPAGSYSDVVLVTESGEPGGINNEIIRALQHTLDYYTNQEIQFKLRLVAAADFEREPPTKNMVIFGVAREGRIGRIIENFVGTDSVRRVLEGRNHIFKQINAPVAGQLTVIVTASSAERLRNVARGNGRVIRDIIEEANRERLRESLLRTEKAGETEDLRTKYGFSIRIPGEYRINRDWGHLPGIEIMRDYPHRGITVSWLTWDGKSLTPADSTRLYDFRAKVMWEIHDKEVMRPELVIWSFGTLGQYEAVRMDGYWESSEETYGGPFICFFIHDRVRGRIWLVDCLVYAPGFDKHILLREAHAIAETFRIH